jgi:prepilin-type N-terminal cleavage/methylation domain-containing protein
MATCHAGDGGNGYAPSVSPTIALMQTRVHQTQRITPTRRHGLTLVELIVVMAVLAVLALMLLPTKGGSKHRAQRIACISNLKLIGLEFRIYANDNEERFPTHGWREHAALIDRDPHPRQVFTSLSNELVTPLVLACPSDPRKPARDWSTLANVNISYFVGLDAAPELPMMLLAGDRNLTTNGTPVGPGLFPLTTNTMLGWSTELHRLSGNVVMGDGSVQPSTSTRFLEMVRQQGVATNWLSIP